MLFLSVVILFPLYSSLDYFLMRIVSKEILFLRRNFVNKKDSIHHGPGRETKNILGVSNRGNLTQGVGCIDDGSVGKGVVR